MRLANAWGAQPFSCGIMLCLRPCLFARISIILKRGYADYADGRVHLRDRKILYVHKYSFEVFGGSFEQRLSDSTFAL